MDFYTQDRAARVRAGDFYKPRWERHLWWLVSGLTVLVIMAGLLG